MPTVTKGLLFYMSHISVVPLLFGIRMVQYTDISKAVNRIRTDNAMAKKKKGKRTNNDLQNITQKTKDRATRTPLKHFWFLVWFVLHYHYIV
jgi:hypothetical protein